MIWKALTIRQPWAWLIMFGFMLRDPKPLAAPVPVKGALSFWKVSEADAVNLQ